MAAVPVLRIVGELSGSTMGGVRSVMAALADESRFVLDLSAVEAVDPGAVKDLVGTIRGLQLLGRAVCVVCEGPVVPGALRAGGADQVVPLASSVEGARVLLEA